MTIDELLELAHQTMRTTPAVEHKTPGAPPLASEHARAVLAMLGESQPCGWPEPVTKGPSSLWWEPLGMLLTSDEARAIAVMLLRGADAAEVR